MVGLNDASQGAQRRHLLGDLVAAHGVRLKNSVLLVGEGAWLRQERAWDADLAHVVHLSGEHERSQLTRGEAHSPADGERIARDAADVAERLHIFRFDSIDKLQDGSIEAAVELGERVTHRQRVRDGAQ